MSPSMPIPRADTPLKLGSPFPAIADYGFLSDCHTAAGGQGRILRLRAQSGVREAYSRPMADATPGRA